MPPVIQCACRRGVEDKKVDLFTADPETTLLASHLNQHLEHNLKEQRIIPALITAIADEENSAGSDFERLSSSSSYLSQISCPCCIPGRCLKDLR